LEYISLRRKQLQLFTVQEINSFISRMLDTLELLQKKRIAHRDIKPENILVRNH
jgi:serine/threonine protein kinase